MSDASIEPDALSSVLEDLVPRPMMFPGEDPEAYEGLRQALLHDLAPRSPYQRLLAENLVTVEWEAFRHRRMRDDLIRAKARDLAAGAFTTGEVTEVGANIAKQNVLSKDLFGSESDMAAAAAAVLEGRKVSVGEIVAKAYSRVSGQVEVHEKKLAELEIRRRRLSDDFDRLRAATRPPVEDAEIL